MILIILLVSGLLLILGLILLLDPRTFFKPLEKVADKPWLRAFAIAVRLVLGALLITNADASRFPAVIQVIGWISLIAAFALIAIGRDRFNQLMAWALTLVKSFGRAAGVLTVLFSCFLIYAFT